MRRLVLVSALFVASTSLAGPEPEAPVGTAFRGDWDEAFEEAKRRNVPVLVAIGKDGKDWSSQFKREFLFRFLNDRVIVLVAHRGGEHQPETRVDPKTKETSEFCPLYPAITCAVHAQIYTDKSGLWDWEEAPYLVICRPDGSTHLEKAGGKGPKGLMEKLEEAQFSLGEGVFASDLTRLEKKLAQGDEKREKGMLKGALKVYEKELSSKRTKGHMKVIVEAHLKDLDVKALQMIEEAKEKKDLETLNRIAREMKGREAGEKAAEAVAELEGAGK